MNCLNLSLPVTYNGKKVPLQTILDDLSNILGSQEAAYASLMMNNSHPLYETREGKPSEQFRDILSVVKDKDTATLLKANTFTTEFKDKFGDWINQDNSALIVDTNSEPKLFRDNGLYYFVGTNGNIIPMSPGSDYSGLQTQSAAILQNRVITSYENTVLVDAGKGSTYYHVDPSTKVIKNKVGNIVYTNESKGREAILAAHAMEYGYAQDVSTDDGRFAVYDKDGKVLHLRTNEVWINGVEDIQIKSIVKKYSIAPVKYDPKLQYLKNPRIASTSEAEGIRINPVKSTGEFTNYMLGAGEGKVSEQKKVVSAELDKLGYPLDHLSKYLDTPHKVNTFILLHENSHVASGTSDFSAYRRLGSDYLNPELIDIEVRATMDAITAMGIPKEGKAVPVPVPPPEFTVMYNKVILPKANVPEGTVHTGDFFKANGLSSTKISGIDNVAEVHTNIMHKANEYGIGINPIALDSAYLTSYTPVNSGGKVQFNKDFDKLSKEDKYKYLLRAMVQGIIVREVQNMEVTDREDFLTAINVAPGLMIRNGDEAMVEKFKDSLVGLIDTYFNDKEVIKYLLKNVSPTSGRLYYNIVFDAIISSLPFDNSVALKSIVDVVTMQAKLNADNTKVKPVEQKRYQELTKEELNSKLNEQLVPSTDTNIAVGSIVSYSESGDFTKGTTRMLVTGVNKNGMVTAMTIDSASLYSKSAMFQKNKQANLFQKVGDYSLIDNKVAVMEGGDTINLEKLRNNEAFINSELPDDRDMLINSAIRVRPTDSTTSKALVDLTAYPVFYSNFKYKSVDDAYKSLSPKASSTIMVESKDGKLITEKEALLESIVTEALKQSKELSKEVKAQFKGDTSGKTFDVAGTAKEFTTTGNSNKLVEAVTDSIKNEHVPNIVGSTKVIRTKDFNELKRMHAAGEAIYTMRINPGTKLQGLSEHYNFGNIFTGSGIKNVIPVGANDKSVEAKEMASRLYKEWLTTDMKTVIDANGKEVSLAKYAEKKKWILQHNSKLIGRNLSYFAKGYYSHADALAEIVNSKEEAKAPTPVEEHDVLYREILEAVASVSKKNRKEITDNITALVLGESNNTKLTRKNVLAITNMIAGLNLAAATNMINGYASQDTSRGNKVQIAMSKVLLSLSEVKAPQHVVVDKANTANQFAEKDTVAILPEDNTENDSLYETVLNAIRSGVKEFVTYTREELEGSIPYKASIQEGINLIESNGYILSVEEDGIATYSKVNKVQRDAITPTVKTKLSAETINTNISGTGIGISFHSETGAAPFDVLGENFVGKEVSINPSIVNSEAFREFLNQNPTKVFNISTDMPDAPAFIKGLKDVKTGKYPDNLRVLGVIKETVKINERVDALGAKVDGTIILRGVTLDMNLGFDLSEDQMNALNQYADWLHDKGNKKAFSIEGIAGTGKTTLLRVAREYALALGKNTEFTALTNMASINLEMLIKAEATTLHKLLKIKPSIYDAKNSSIQFKEEDASFGGIEYDSVVFVDEVSMATDSMTKKVIEEGRRAGAKIVLIGSIAQLSPVKAKKNSIAFNEQYVQKYTLDQVKRQGEGNPALPVYKHLSFNQDKGFRFDRFVHPTLFYNTKTHDGVITHSNYARFRDTAIKAAKRSLTNPMYSRVLSYKVETADSWNKIMRKALGFEGKLEAGENIFFTEKPVHPDSKLGLVYKVDKVTSMVEQIVDGIDGKLNILKAHLSPGVNYEIEGEKRLSNITVDIVPNTPDNDKATIEYATYLQYLFEEAANAFGKDKKKATREYLQAKSAYSFMRKVKLKGVKGEVISIGMNYGYASTIHKAQGSTFTTTFIDEKDIKNTKSYWRNKALKEKNNLAAQQELVAYNELLYTALTRASKVSFVYSLQPAIDTSKETASGVQTPSVLESRTLKVGNNLSVTEDSLGHKAFKVVEVLGKAESVTIKATTAKNTNDRVNLAIMSAVPNESLVTDQTNPGVINANRKLRESIVTDINDNRLGSTKNKDSMDSHNKAIFDVYSESILRAFNRELTEEQLVDNSEVIFQVKSLNLKSKLDADIRDLEQLKTKRTRESAPGAEIQAIQIEINNRRSYMKDKKELVSWETLKTVAEEDLRIAEEALKAPEITQETYNKVKNILDMWMEVGDFSFPDRNPMLTESEATNEIIQKEFNWVGNKASKLASKLDIQGNKLLLKDAQSNLKATINKEDLFSLRSTLSWFSKMFQSIAKIDNPIIAHIMSLINDANSKADIQAISESKKLAQAFKDLKTTGFDENVFWQVTDDGAVTGKLTHEYSSKYDSLEKSAKWSDRAFIKYKKETILLDPNKSITQRDVYIKELSAELGAEKAEEMVDLSAKKWKEFSKIRNEYFIATYGQTFKEREATLKSNLKNKPNSATAIGEMDEFKRWGEENNPISAINQMNSVKSYSKIQASSLAKEFVVAAPKKFKVNKTGTAMEDTGNYDSNYATIQGNTEAKVLYDMASDITKSAKANFQDDSMSDYALGGVSRDLADSWRESGVSKVTTRKTSDNLMSKFTTNYATQTVEDPISGTEIKTIKKGITTLESQINTEFKFLKEQKYGDKKINPIQRQELYAEASRTVMKEDKADLFMALNNLNLASLSYSYKSAIKPSIDTALNLAKGIKAGTTRDGRAVMQKDVETMMKMTEYFVNSELYNETPGDRTYKIMDKKFYTQEEKIKRNVIQDRIASLDPDTQKDLIAVEQNKLNALGSNVTIGSVVDGISSLARYAMIGWGFQASIVNALQGQTANMIMSAANDQYDFNHLTDAYKIMRPGSPYRAKVENLISNYSLLGDIMYDFNKTSPFTKSKTKTGKLMEALKPFQPTKVTEKGNQGAVMIAVMLKAKVRNKTTGEVLSMWEAVDDSGKLTDNFEYEGSTGDDAIVAKVREIRELITAIHGDYINPKMIQSEFMGRAATMFKSWFYDPFMVRFGTEKFNYITNTTTKGRFITAFENGRKYKLNIKAYREAMANGEFSEVDAENMRTFLAEVKAVVAVMFARMLAKWALCDEKETGGTDCGKFTYVYNTMQRFESETKTFMSLDGYYDMVSNPIAIARYLNVINTTTNKMAALTFSEDIGDGEQWGEIGGKVLKEIPVARRIMLEKSLINEINNMY